MNLREDIKRATKINPPNHSSWHVTPKHQKKNSYSNGKHLPKKKFQLMEDPSDRCLPPTQVFTCQNEVISDIIEANGGIDYSNESIEQHLIRKQLKKRQNMHDKDVQYLEESISSNYDSPSYDTSTSDFNVVSDDVNVTEDNSCPPNHANERTGIQLFSRNALISGLIKNEVIRMGDLYIDNNAKITKEGCPIQSNSHCKSVSDVSSIQSHKKDTTSETESLADYNRPVLVPHPHEPDFFGHPLQIYGKIEEKGIDFTIPSCGVKSIVTPRQFFMNIPENTFAFVSKKRINKSN